MRTKAPNQAEKMLQAAAKLFGGQRFHKVRMEDIAAAAAVGKGTLYRYFQDKDDLYFALLARASEEIQVRLEQAVAAASTYRSKLIAFVASGIEYFDEQPHVLPLIQRAEVLHGEESPWQAARNAFSRIVLDVFSQAAAAGEFTVRDPENGALMLIGGVRSVVLFGKQPRVQGLASSIVTQFLDGAIS